MVNFKAAAACPLFIKPLSPRERQNTQPRPFGIDRDDSPCNKLRLSLLDYCQHRITKRDRRQNVVPDQDDARTVAFGRSQDGGKIQVGGKNDVIVLRGLLHQFVIGSVRSSRVRPVNRGETSPGEKVGPVRRQIHVDQNIHSWPASAISRSCVRQAA